MWRLNNVCTNLQRVWLLYEWTQFQLSVLFKMVVVLCMPSFFWLYHDILFTTKTHMASR
jgi:hypothetical protein